MSQRKLLLADDSVTIQKVVNLTFADEGIDVLTVGDGDSAMEQLNQFRPDLIMADVNMPGLNGYEICERIKQSNDFSKTPVILLVGSFEPFDESEAKRVGADDFLTKPFQSIRQLVNKVTELLDSNSDTAEYPVDENTESAEQVSENNSPTVQYNDSTLDDEMIQTNPPSGFIFDEAQKFTTREVDEPAEDYARTKPFTEEEIRQFYDSENIEETADESLAEQPQSETHSPENTQTMSKYYDDVLELPPAEQYGSPEDFSEASFGTKGKPFAFSGQNQNTASFAGSPQLSPETIDMIVQKVVERLSDKAVKEIAWEVVPQMADLIIKKMAAEKFKE